MMQGRAGLVAYKDQASLVYKTEKTNKQTNKSFSEMSL